MCYTGANGPTCPFQRGFDGDICRKPKHVQCPMDMVEDDECDKPTKISYVYIGKLKYGTPCSALVYLLDVIVECDDSYNYITNVYTDDVVALTNNSSQED